MEDNAVENNEVHIVGEIQKLKELLLDSERLEEIKSKIDNSVNIFDILKATDAEIRHSNMLAWFLDPNANHGLGDEILKRLISWFANECLDGKDDEAVYLLLCNYHSFSVRREWKRIDLLLVSSEAKTIIAIENKIHSNEHGNQLTRYENAVKELFPDYKHYFLYLTLDGDDSSKPDIWHSIGYKSVIEWVGHSLKLPFLHDDVRQILEQYISVLGRKIMGYSPEVVELCQKIYNKHKEALDLIYEIIDQDDESIGSAFKEWFEEWRATEHISEWDLDNKKTIYFRTPGLDDLFPIVNEEQLFPCYYWIKFPFTKRVVLEFGSSRFDENTKERFLKIKSSYNNRQLKDDWQWHRLTSTNLRNYNPDESDEFSDFSDSLKAELERIIIKELPKLEEEMRAILKKK